MTPESPWGSPRCRSGARRRRADTRAWSGASAARAFGRPPRRAFGRPPRRPSAQQRCGPSRRALPDRQRSRHRRPDELSVRRCDRRTSCQSSAGARRGSREGSPAPGSCEFRRRTSARSPLHLVPASADVDQACAQIDVLTAQRLKLAASQAGIENGSPNGAVLDRQRREQSRRLSRGNDPARTLRPTRAYPNSWGGIRTHISDRISVL